MRSAAALASALACFASSTGFAADAPPWEREGLRGAVRPEMGSPQPGEAAPDFELTATDGAKVRLASLQGHWVVLHFTATWCPFCDAEVEHLGNLAKAYADRNVKTLIIDVNEDLPTWKAYAAKNVSPLVAALQKFEGEQLPARLASWEKTVAAQPDSLPWIILDPVTSQSKER